MEDLAREYVTYARQFSNNGSLSKAFDLYIMAFEKCPAIKNRHEAEFRGVINKLNEVLAKADKVEEIFNNYGQAIGFYPTNMHIVNDIGKYLYKCGFYSEAWCHFNKALGIDSGFVNAEKNLNSVKNILMQRWHFRMLNDKIRNEAYQAAIGDTINPCLDSVLDLSSGPCLLSLFAYQHNPIAITVVESNEVMTQLSESITQGIGIYDIIILNQKSTTMKYLDIGGKRSVLITEMFDAGLFGEQILQALSHAWEYLINNIGRVLPRKAEFFIVGGNCDRLHHKYQLSWESKNMLNISNLDVHITTSNQTYDCKDVHFFKDLTFLTENQSVLEVDFNDPNDLKEKLTRTEPYEVNVKAKESGTINVYIGWFNLYLTDKITITTNPQSSKKAITWQQAVFFDTKNVNVKADDTITLNVMLNGGKLSMAPSDSTNQFIRVSPDTMRFMNDPDYTKMINGCIGMASVYLGQIADISQISIIDLCPFPLFGFLMVKRGAQFLTCYAKTPEDKCFFEEVFKANDIPLTNVKILVGEELSIDAFRNDKYHAIFCHVLDPCGDVNNSSMEIALHLKDRHLMQGGLFLPADVKIVAQVASSQWLDLSNQVYNENACGYDVARHTSRFQVSQNFDIDLTNLEHTTLTEPVDVGSLMDQSRTQTVIVPVTKAGEANAILCWYKIELMEELNEVSTNKGTSFTYATAFLIPKITLTTDKPLKMTRASGPNGSYKVSFEIET
ncbi:hypothetical protein O3G_MSEX010010 [Manduca sexta]|uniref:Protein arginine N-methyltransferase domain-containing protein n=1 Tax=Manduca sexta TaxID=7130 RepID=A0A922CSV6_MANSE|nr:hypothetical protein O3G_MSEX010010 [Manduca sexta]KAG6456906.1 hypothetical protein O3G_MSEX010010 [Manduca sexta]